MAKKAIKKRNPQDADVQRVKRSDDAIRQDIVAMRLDIHSAENRLKDLELQLGRAIRGELFHAPPVDDSPIAAIEDRLDRMDAHLRTGEPYCPPPAKA